MAGLQVSLWIFLDPWKEEHSVEFKIFPQFFISTANFCGANFQQKKTPKMRIRQSTQHSFPVGISLHEHPQHRPRVPFLFFLATSSEDTILFFVESFIDSMDFVLVFRSRECSHISRQPLGVNIEVNIVPSSFWVKTTSSTEICFK